MPYYVTFNTLETIQADNVKVLYRVTKLILRENKSVKIIDTNILRLKEALNQL